MPPKRLPEMDDAEWLRYSASATEWMRKHLAKQKAELTQVTYLYHATSANNKEAIKQNGLCPRDPEWTAYKPPARRYDASKDGFLSMSVTKDGAGAMGGTAILLRMRVATDIGDWDFRKISETEVKTTKSIPAERLEWRSLGSTVWAPLVVAGAALPAAAAVPAAAGGGTV